MTKFVSTPDRKAALEQACLNAATPRQKTEALLNLCALYDKLGLHGQMLQRAEEAITQARKARFRKGIADALRTEGRARFLLGQYEPAIARLDAACNLYIPLGERKGIIAALCLLATVHSFNSDPEQARQALVRAEQESGKGPPDSETVLVYTGWCGFYISIGDPEKVIAWGQRGLDLAERINDSAGIGRACHSLGFVAFGFGDTRTGLHYYHRVLRIARETGNEGMELQALNDLAGHYVHNNRPELALELAEAYMKKAEEMTAGIAIVQGETLMCQVLTQCNELDRGLTHARRMTRAARRYGSPSLMTGACLIRAELHLARHEPDQAIGWLEQGLQSAHKAQAVPSIMTANKRLAELFEQKGDLESSYRHFRDYMAHHEKLLGFMKQKAVASATVAAQLEQGERERERLRMRMQSLENAIKEQQQELTATALLVAEKDRTISGLQMELRELLQLSPEESYRGIAALAARLGRSLDPERAWEEFHRQFRVADPGFVRELNERFGHLTPAELKICTLLRVNLTTKDIAALLSIQPSSVDIYRSAIRKKIGLPRGTNLTAFLSGL